MANQRKQNTEKAFLYEPKQTAERISAELFTRPIRLAFLIYEDIDKNKFTQIIEYLSLIWGGYHSCLIPTDGQNISKEWWDVLRFYNPDQVVICKNEQSPGISQTLFRKIECEIQPYGFVEWINTGIDAILERQWQGVSDFLNSVPVWPILKLELERIKQPLDETKSNIRIPVIREDHPYYLLVAAQTGIAKGFYQDAYSKLFKAGQIEFKTEDVDEYIENLSMFFDRASPLDMTAFGNKSTFTLSFSGEKPAGLAIILVGRNWVRDICLYWNFHLSSNFTAVTSRQILLPYSIFRSSRQIKKFIDLLLNANWCPSQIKLFSDSVDNKKRQYLRDRLDRLFNGAKEVKVSSFQNIADFNVSNSSTGDSTLVEDGKVVFRAPTLQFDNFFTWGNWAVDIKLQSPYEYPLSSKLNYFLCGEPSEQQLNFKGSYWVRPGGYQVTSAKANKETHFTTIYLVKPFSAFQALLSDKGYSIQLNDIHSYTEAFLKILGSSSLLEKKEIRELFWSMRTGNAFSYSAVKCNLKLGEEGDNVIADLVTKRILLRGIELTCDYCGLNKWYSINTIDEIMQCAGCLKMIRLPTEPVVKYVLNELVIKAVCHGAIPALLTMQTLERLTIGRTLAAYGLGITKNSFQTDIDLITTYGGYSVLCECKEYKSYIPPKEKGKAIVQIKGLVDIAKDIGSPIVILSTLLPEDQQDFLDIANALYRLNTKNKKGDLAIHLLSLNSIKFIDLKDPSRNVEHVDLFSPLI